MLLTVVGAVGADAIGSPARSANRPSYRRDRVDERDQLSDVVAVPAGELPRKRCAFAIDEEVMLRPVSGSINRARARFGAPFFA